MDRLIERIAPQLSARIRTQISPQPDGREQYEILREGDLLTLRATSASAAACALGRCLRECFGIDLSGCGNDRAYEGAPETLPAKPLYANLPAIRWGMTYESYLHGAMYWDLPRWERELDRLALMGVNCMYMPIGHEAVWYYAALEMGIRREDAMEFLSGRAYYPLQLMGRLDSFLSLTDTNDLKARRALACSILERMRELGIEPALPGFAGHAPKYMKGYNKQANLFFLTNFAEFPFTYRVSANDALFAQMADALYSKQAEFFGTAKYYVADPFLGVFPRMREEQLMEKYGRAIHDSLQHNVPGAIWVSHTCAHTAALLRDVPCGNALVLDDSGTLAQSGLPHIACVRLNKGGHTALTGDVQSLCTLPVPPDAAGIGILDENLSANPLLSACAGQRMAGMNKKPESLFIRTACTRWGSEEDCLREAAKILYQTCYGTQSPDLPVGSIPACRPSTELRHTAPGDTLALHYDNRELCLALEKMLASEGDYTDGYCFDVCDVTRQMLSNYARRLYAAVMEGYAKRDSRLFETATNGFLRLLGDMDRVLRTREEFCLGSAMAAVGAQAHSQTDKQNFEVCFLSFLTMLGPYKNPDHYDLFWQEWSDLTGEYYAKRWHAFFELLAHGFKKRGDISTICRDQVEERNPATGNKFYKSLDKIERTWISGCTPSPRSDEDTLDVAAELLAKYAPMIRREEIR